MNRDFEFEEPWESCDLPDCLLQQLHRELPAGHPLEGRVEEVLASRVDSDDILVRIKDGFAMIHLTWCRRTKIELPFPHFVTFADWDTFLSEVYLPELEEWKDQNPAFDWEELLR